MAAHTHGGEDDIEGIPARQGKRCQGKHRRHSKFWNHFDSGETVEVVDRRGKEGDKGKEKQSEKKILQKTNSSSYDCWAHVHPQTDRQTVNQTKKTDWSDVTIE